MSFRRVGLIGVVVLVGACSTSTTPTPTTTANAPTTTSLPPATATTRVIVSGGDSLPPLPDGVGPLLVAETDRDRVLLVHPDGTLEVVLDGVPKPRGLGLSPDGLTLAVAVAGRESGEGAIILVRADRHVSMVIDGLDHPEDVAFYRDDTLVFTGYADQTLGVIGIDGSGLRTIPVEGHPTGITYVDWFPVSWGGPQALHTMIFSTWEGTVFDFDPATDRISSRGRWGLPDEGYGHLNGAGWYELCVAITSANEVVCLTGDLGGGFDIGQPVDVAGAIDRIHMVFTGSAGVSIFDGYGLETLPVDHPAGLAVLWRAAQEWLTADASTYVPDETYPDARTQAAALQAVMREAIHDSGVSDIVVEVRDDTCWTDVPAANVVMTVASGTPGQAETALKRLGEIGLKSFPTGPGQTGFHLPQGDVTLDREHPPGFTLRGRTDCYWPNWP